MSERTPLSNYAVREYSNAHKGAVRCTINNFAVALDISNYEVKILGWSCNGRKLATGSTDETVRTWSIDTSSTGRDRRDSELQLGREANALVWHPTHPDQLATSAADNLIKVWDVRTNKAASTTKLKKNAFLFLAWNPGDPSIVAAVQQDSETFFIDVQKQKVFKILPSRLQVNQVKFSKDGKLFFRTVASGGVEVFTFPDLVKLHCLMGHAATTYSLDISANEEYLVSGAVDATVSLFELQTLTCVRSFTKFDHPARSVSFSADSSLIAYFAEGHPGINIEKTLTGERAAQLPTVKPVEDLAWNPKHPILAFTGNYSDATSSSSRTSSSRSGSFFIYATKS